MSKYFIEDETLYAIGDAIRLRRDTVDEINPEDMPLEIILIESGGGGGITWNLLGVATQTTFDANMRQYQVPVPNESGLHFLIIRVVGDNIQGAGSSTLLCEIFPFFDGSPYWNTNTPPRIGGYGVTAAGKVAPNAASTLAAPGARSDAHTIVDGKLVWMSSGTSYYIGIGNEIYYAII